MWVDVAVVSIPLFAIGIADNQTPAFTAAAIVLTIAIIGIAFSLYHILTDRPVRDSDFCKDLSMAATYVWPCILTGLIVDRLGVEGWPYYFLAAFAMCLIIMANHTRYL